MSGRYPDWNVQGRSWPNRSASRFVEVDGYSWHVQTMGPDRPDAPVCLLIHGTGAATHSWRDLMPLLAKEYRVIAMDLPGHGFTRPNFKRRVTLPLMTSSIAALLDELDARPDLIVGHSAGAAIGMQLLLDRGWNIPLVGLNPALMPFPGLAAKLFPQLAKMLFTNPLVSQIFARMARYPGAVERFLGKATGSTIDRAGLKQYELLMSCSGHCDGAIRMMASWRLEPLQARMVELEAPVLLVHASGDTAIPRTAVADAAALIPQCTFEELKGLGHLAHEERPEQIAGRIGAFAAGMASQEAV